jgi:hypothetical protein
MTFVRPFLDHDLSPVAVPSWRKAAELGPGEIWLLQMPAMGSRLPSWQFRALTAANVVIYDRALVTRIAEILPLGGYAELAGPNALDRSFGLALDGWSVIRTVAADPLLHADGLRVLAGRLADRLLDRGIAGSSPVRLIADGEFETTTTLGALADLDEAADATAIALGPFGSGAAPRLYAVAANGLAG